MINQIAEAVKQGDSAALYCERSLIDSLARISVPKSLVDEILSLNLASDEDIAAFGKKFAEEIRDHKRRFYEDTVPVYFSEHVIPLVPKEGVLMDIGCKSGVLLRLLASSSLRRIGIDIAHYDGENLGGAEFALVNSASIGTLLNKYSPSVITLTWVAHHMTAEEQHCYFEAFQNCLQSESRIIFLEDGYSTKLLPAEGSEWHAQFIDLSFEDRMRAMQTLDFIANRVLGQEPQMPVPGSYRTLEEWINLGSKYGLRLTYSKYMGFPKNRDIHTPQCVFTFTKE